MEPDDFAPRPEAGIDGHLDGVHASELGKALLMAQQVADQTLAEARQEADRLISEARATQAPAVSPEPARTTLHVEPPPTTPHHLEPTPVDLEPLLGLIASLASSVTDGLSRAAEQLDSVRIDVGTRLGVLTAELERVRSQLPAASPPPT